MVLVAVLTPLTVDKDLPCGCHLHVKVYNLDRNGDRITDNDFARVDAKCPETHHEIMDAHTQLLLSIIEKQKELATI